MIDKKAQLLESKQKIEKRLERVKEKLAEEKENEDAWPGHGGSAYQLLEDQYQVLANQLFEIRKELRTLKGS